LLSSPLSLDDFLVRDSDDLASALRRIDTNGIGIAFALDQAGRFIGTLRPSDLDGQLIPDSLVRAVVRRDQQKASVRPVLDSDGRPVDFASPARERRIPVGEPDLRGNELKYVTDCVTTNWISSQGQYVRRFEKDFAARLGVEHALAVSNGTVALHLALAAYGIGPGDEVIIPDLTFAATINSVIYVGATPVIVDVDPVTWNMCPAAVAKAITPRTKAIMPVHLYGQPSDMDALNALVRPLGIPIIEDAAEAVGASYKGVPCGGLGDAACFSFFSNKVLTTGEGGMVIFRDAAVAERGRRLRDHGMDPAKRYWHNEVGFNYRLTNLQAAIGCAQLERLDEFLTRKRALARHYVRRLAALPEITLPATVDGLVNSYWMFSIIVDFAGLGLDRDAFMARLSRAGIESRPLFYPMHVMPPYRDYAKGAAFPVTDRLSANGLSLPSGVLLTEEDIDYVCDVIEDQIRTRRLLRQIPKQ
jgi:perosamine synthetase